MTRNTHSRGQEAARSHIYVASVAATALVAAATVAPTVARAEDVPAHDTDATSEAAKTSSAPASPAAAYTTTETVVTKEDTQQTFDSEVAAQGYLDDAKATYASKSTASETYTVTTEGPTPVEAETTHTESSVVTSGKQTFEDESDARQYVADATSPYEGKESYAIESGVEAQDTGETSTSVEQLPGGSKGGFESEDAANEWLDQQRAQYRDGDGVSYTVTATVTALPGTTTESSETFNVAFDKTVTFATKAEAEDFVKSLEASTYVDTGNVTYTITPTYTHSATTENDGPRQKAGDARTTTFGGYDTEGEAQAALDVEKLLDPSGDLHEVSFSGISPTTEVVKEATTETEVVPGAYYSSEEERDEAKAADETALQNDGWSTSTQDIDHVEDASVSCMGVLPKKDTYVLPQNSFLAVSDGKGGVLIWTADGTNQDKVARALLGDAAGTTPITSTSGTGTIFSAGYTNNPYQTYDYTVSQNDDGTYTLAIRDRCGNRPDPCSLPCLPCVYYGIVKPGTSYHSYRITATKDIPAVTATTYSFTKTVQDYTQPTKRVDHWSVNLEVEKTTRTTSPTTYDASYTVAKATTSPVYVYEGRYVVTHKTQVPDTAWRAAYEVTKTTTYTPASEPESPATPTPSRIATPSVAQTHVVVPSYQQAAALPAAHLSTAASALPKTGDTNQNGVLAAIAALLGVGSAAAGAHLRGKEH